MIILLKFKYNEKYLYIILASILFYYCAGTRPAGNPINPLEKEKLLYVIFHGWHTGIIIRADDAGSELNFLSKHITGEYYEFSWGDSEFFQAREITTGLKLKAAFLPSRSVMHVLGMERQPENIFSINSLYKFKIPESKFHSLKQFIAGSFKQNDKNNILIEGKSKYGNSMFFKGTGIYWFANTCNTWTANVLYTAGLPVRSFLIVTSGGLLEQVNRLKAAK